MPSTVEPWLRNTHTDLDAARRQVIHALELTAEDCARWCADFTSTELNTVPLGLPSVAFQMRHIVRSLDRLLTYAEGRALTDTQRTLLSTEAESSPYDGVFTEFEQGFQRAFERVRALLPESYETVRYVGRDRLPTTVGALLIHCAEHTQRHAGQMVTTAKVVLALRSQP